MTWYEKIQENNPSQTRSGKFNDFGKWYAEVYDNNPLNLPPENNPSQYDFEALWRHVVYKKRGFSIKDCDGVKTFKKILTRQANPITHSYRYGFNFAQ